MFDVVGHYSRADILNLTVDNRPLVPVTFTSSPCQSKYRDVELEDLKKMGIYGDS